MLGGKILGRGRNGGTLEHSRYTGGAWRTEALTGLHPISLTLPTLTSSQTGPLRRLHRLTLLTISSARPVTPPPLLTAPRTLTVWSWVPTAQRIRNGLVHGEG